MTTSRRLEEAGASDALQGERRDGQRAGENGVAPREGAGGAWVEQGLGALSGDVTPRAERDGAENLHCVSPVQKGDKTVNLLLEC